MAAESSTRVALLAGDDHPLRTGRAQPAHGLVGPPVVGAVAAGEEHDLLPGVRRDQVVGGLGGTGHVDGDATGCEEVRCERRARGVRRDRAHGREEHVGIRRIVAQCLEGRAVAAYLTALGRGHPLGKRLGEVRELGEPGQRSLAGRDLAVALLDGLRDLGVQVQAFLEPAEQLPGSDGEVVGELLDGVGTTGRVGHGGDVRLVDEQVRGVARDPPAQRVGSAERAVEGQHGDGVRATHTGCERGDGGAEHVDPGVVLAHHRSAGHGVLVLLADAGTAELEDAAPEPTCRAKLGDRRELLVGRGVPELDDLGGLVEIEPGVGQGAQVVRTDGERVGELLDVGRAAVVDLGRVDHEDAHAHLPCLIGEVPSGVPGVQPQVGARVQLAAVGVPQEGTGTGLGRLQDDRREVEQHLVEQDAPVGVLGDLEPQRRDSALQVGEQRLVVRLGVRDSEVRPDVPRPRSDRAAHRDERLDELRRTERGDADPVEGRTGELVPGLRVGVVVGEPARLAEHGGGRCLPLGAVVAVLGRSQVEAALVRLELLGLGQAALDGLLLGHARRLGSPPPQGH